MSSDRQFFVDQTQSLNLFVSHSNIGKMNSMYLYAWKMCLKTINYYIRSTAATNGTQIGLQLHEIEEIKKKEKEEKQRIINNQTKDFISNRLQVFSKACGRVDFQ